MSREHFRQVVDGTLEDVCLEAGVGYDESCLLSRLVLIANWRTGKVHGSAQDLAERLGVGRKRMVRMLDTLVDAGLVLRDHPRGHEGVVTVLGWADLVRLPADLADTLPSRNAHTDASDQGKRPVTPESTRATRDDAQGPYRPERDASETPARVGMAYGKSHSDASDQGIASSHLRRSSASSGSSVPEGDREGDAGGGHALAVPMCEGSVHVGTGVREWDDRRWYCSECEPMTGQPVEGVPTWCSPTT